MICDRGRLRDRVLHFEDQRLNAAMAAIGVKGAFEAGFHLAVDRIDDGDDLLARAIVCFECDDLCALESLAKFRHRRRRGAPEAINRLRRIPDDEDILLLAGKSVDDFELDCIRVLIRSEEHKSELQSLMRISYAVFCLKKTTDS